MNRADQDQRDLIPVALTGAHAGYADWLTELKMRIHAAQHPAALSVNGKLIGETSSRGRQRGGSAKVVDRLGHHLPTAFPFAPDGRERPDLVLNQAPYRPAQILVAGANFGCGSSPRERGLGSLRLRCALGDCTEFRRHFLQQQPELWFATGRAAVALSGPLATMERLGSLLASPEFWPHVWDTLRAFGFALLIAVASIGACTGFSNPIEGLP